jgi:hypothetical protein
MMVSELEEDLLNDIRATGTYAEPLRNEVDSALEGVWPEVCLEWWGKSGRKLTIYIDTGNYPSFLCTDDNGEVDDGEIGPHKNVAEIWRWLHTGYFDE